MGKGNTGQAASYFSPECSALEPGSGKSESLPSTKSLISRSDSRWESWAEKLVWSVAPLLASLSRLEVMGRLPWVLRFGLDAGPGLWGQDSSDWGL